MDKAIQIDGYIEGSLTMDGALKINPSGTLIGDVETVNATIEGRYEGNMRASGDVRIAASAEVTGSVEAHTLAITLGALVNGRVAQTGNGGPQPLPPQETRDSAIASG